MKEILFATTPTLEGWAIREHLGLITARTVIGTGAFTDFFSGITDFFGARSGSYQEKLDRLEHFLMENLRSRLRMKYASASAVVGLRIDYDEISGAGKSMLIVTASGTAVIAERTLKTGGSPRTSHQITKTDLKDLKKAEQASRSLRSKNPISETEWRLLRELSYAPAALFVLRAEAADSRAPFELSQEATDYFESLEPEAATEALYLSMEQDSYLASRFASDMIHRLDLFDADRFDRLLNSDSQRVRVEAIQLVNAHKRQYGHADLDSLERLRTSIRNTTFEEAADDATSKTLLGGERLGWRCLRCGEIVKSNRNRCNALAFDSTCSADRRGFREGDTDPGRAQSVLAERIYTLRHALDLTHSEAQQEEALQHEDSN